MRIIPRNTKVSTEFFSGVSLADIVVGTVGVLFIFFVVISNLPYKLAICGTVVAIFALLLVRIDTEANYMFLLRIVKHFSYYRSYRKVSAGLLEEMEEAKKIKEKKTKEKEDKRKKTGLIRKEEKKKDEGAA